MTNFTADGFNWDGMYLFWGTYPMPHAERRFVARFKYGRPAASAAHFRKFLIKNFTVEEYFAARETGKSPVEILETKGYISYNTARALKTAGYPVTQAGRTAYIHRVEAARHVAGSR